MSWSGARRLLPTSPGTNLGRVCTEAVDEGAYGQAVQGQCGLLAEGRDGAQRGLAVELVRPIVPAQAHRDGGSCEAGREQGWARAEQT